jgi:hypothetical protein
MNGPGNGPPWGLSVADDLSRQPGRRLRPATFSSLFEIGARLLRRHAAPLLIVAVLFQLATALLSAVTGARLADAIAALLPEMADGVLRPFTITEAELRSLGDPLLLVAGASVLTGIMGAVATAGMAWIVAQDYLGRAATTGEAVTIALRRAVAVIATVLISGVATAAILAIGVGAMVAAVVALPPEPGAQGGAGVFLALVAAVALVVAVVYLTVRWSLAAFVVALEPCGPISGLRRSWHLTGDNLWRTLGVIVVLSLVISVLSTVLAQVTVAFAELISPSLDLSRLVDTIVVTAVTVLFAPVAPVVMTVLYHDLRVRRDGWDVPAVPATGAGAGAGTAQQPGTPGD